MAENGFTLHYPLGNFADISYPVENFKLRLLRDVCTLYAGALVSDSLLHMLPYHILKKEKFDQQKKALNCIVI